MIARTISNNAQKLQSLLKKHETFETDLTIHEDRVQQMEKDGTILLEQHNYQADKIKHRLTNMKVATIAIPDNQLVN